MFMSSGLSVKTAIAEQTEDGMTPAVGWETLPNISNGLNTSTTLTDSELLNENRIKSAGMVTGGEISGEISSELMFGTFDKLISAAFWNEWTVSELDTPSQVTIGKKSKFFAVTKDFAEFNAFYLWLGVHVNTMKIEVTTESIVKVMFGLMGLGYETQKTKSFATSPTAAVEKGKASGHSIGDILVDDAPIGVCVEAFSIELNNQAEIQKCLGKNLYGGSIHALIASITGALTLEFSEKSYDILEMQRTGTTMSLVVPIEFEDGSIYELTLPQIQIEGDIPAPSGSGLVKAEVTYKVVNKSPILKRIEA